MKWKKKTKSTAQEGFEKEILRTTTKIRMIDKFILTNVLKH